MIECTNVQRVELILPDQGESRLGRWALHGVSVNTQAMAHEATAAGLEGRQVTVAFRHHGVRYQGQAYVVEWPSDAALAGYELLGTGPVEPRGW